MLTDADVLVLICAVCGALGFLVGWMGGVADGKARSREKSCMAERLSGTARKSGNKPQ